MMSAPVSLGDVIDGKYRVERLLGEGGMGYVVSAWHLQLQERVAIKLLHPQNREKPEIVARFQREARAAVRIKSEHVCRVLDVGSADGQPYTVMEYLVGEDLSAVLSERGSLGIDEAVDYVLQACEAIAEAHALGIVHRDIKPSNLFLTQRPNGTPLVKVLDFGIAKVADALDERITLTTTHSVVGSYAYMSPEQARNASDIDRRADIWSLGVILHKLVVGDTPFEASTASEYISRIAADPPTPLRARKADAPQALEDVILRCLEKDRAKRYPDVAAFARALAAVVPQAEPLVAAIEGIEGGKARIDSTPPPAREPSDIRTAPTETMWTSDAAAPRMRAKLVVVGGALLAVVLALAWMSDNDPALTLSPGAFVRTVAIEPVEPPPAAPAPSVIASAHKEKQPAPPRVAPKGRPVRDNPFAHR